MTTNNGEEARELADRAGTQAKHAAKNSGRAVKTASGPVFEAVFEGAQNTAQDTVRTARKINIGMLGRMSSDTGVGFLALSISIYAGAVAYAKFRQAASGRSRVISS